MGIGRYLADKALERKLCPDCTRRLNKQKERSAINTEEELVTCRCGKKFKYDRLHRSYSPFIENRPSFV